jgi:hypothetical protein
VRAIRADRFIVQFAIVDGEDLPGPVGYRVASLCDESLSALTDGAVSSSAGSAGISMDAIDFEDVAVPILKATKPQIAIKKMSPTQTVLTITRTPTS